MFGSHRYWDGVVDPLSQSHQLIMLDLLGFGKSPKPKFDYTVVDHLDPIEKTVSQIITPESKLTIVVIPWVH